MQNAPILKKAAWFSLALAPIVGAAALLFLALFYAPKVDSEQSIPYARIVADIINHFTTTPKEKLVQDAASILLIKKGGPDTPAAWSGDTVMTRFVGQRIILHAAQDAPGIQYKWTCVAPDTYEIPGDSANRDTLSFIPHYSGKYIFRVDFENSSGGKSSRVVTVLVKEKHPAKPGSHSVVAVPCIDLFRVASSEKDASNTVVKKHDGVFILNGSHSLPGGASMNYSWEQTGGAKLDLSPGSLKMDRIDLPICKPGIYRFQLVVSNGNATSEPAEVELEIKPDDI